MADGVWWLVECSLVVRILQYFLIDNRNEKSLRFKVFLKMPVNDGRQTLMILTLTLSYPHYLL